MKINTPNELPRVDIIDRSQDCVYSRHEYSNGWILVTDLTPDKLEIKSNYSLIKENDGTYSVDLSSPNLNFSDQHHAI